MEMMYLNFKTQSKAKSLFIQEYETSKEINELIRLTDKPTQIEFKKIVELIKLVNNTEHYSGSQWHDYKIHLNAVLLENEFESKIL
ncbi:hypothetical protein DS884_10835 [Tenacibaculum sp. E3R01]|nr:hypothetical protein DS884_10835 [Tenacibaculum sp. E3R01]